MTDARRQLVAEYKAITKPYNKRLQQVIEWKLQYVQNTCTNETQEVEKALERWTREAGRKAKDLEHPPAYYEEAIRARNAAIKRAEAYTEPAESAARHWHFEIVQPIWEDYHRKLEELG